MKHLLLSCETILPDDYPVYYEYVYIGDMKIIKNDVLIRGTVRDLKEELKLKEIRRCDIFGHGSGCKIGDELITMQELEIGDESMSHTDRD